MQTTIRALQKVDTLAIYRQTVLSKLKSVFIRVFDNGTASVKGNFFQKYEVSINSHRPLLFFSLSPEISDPEKKY